MSTDWWGIRDKKVLIFGSGGLGTATAQALVDLGCQVTCADVSEESLLHLQTLVPEVHTIPTDVTASAEVKFAFDRASRLMGGALYAAIHAIGINDRKPVEVFSDDEWARMLSVNLTSAFYVAREAVTRLRPQGEGRIVFFSSVAGRMAHKSHGPYAATKAGMNQLASVLANELAPSGITVNTVAPGYTRTSLTKSHLDEPGVEESLTALVPMERLGTAEDVAGAIAFLISERASYITGETIYVDGGRKLI